MPISIGRHRLCHRKLLFWIVAAIACHQIFSWFSWISFHVGNQELDMQLNHSVYASALVPLGSASNDLQIEVLDLPGSDHKVRFTYEPISANRVAQNGFDSTLLYRPEECESEECAIVKPSFIIIGAQKCGTTSLFRYLNKHPQVAPLSDTSKAMGKKEVRFFDQIKNYSAEHFPEYLKHFPRLSELETFGKSREKRLITGESTPNYIRYPMAAERMKELIPDLKILVMLRDPVDRAYSHYQHALRIDGVKKFYTGGREYADFVEAEAQILAECDKENVEWNELSECYASGAAEASRKLDMPVKGLGRLTWMFQSILRGLYAKQIENYAKFFPPEQFLIIQSEEFYEHTERVMKRIEVFLELEPHSWEKDLETPKVFNFGKGNKIFESEKGEDYGPLAPELKAKLQTIFKPYNEDLQRLFKNDNDFPRWDY